MNIDDFCRNDGIYEENDRLYLKRLHESDKEDFMKLKIDTSSIKTAYQYNEFSNLL